MQSTEADNATHLDVEIIRARAIQATQGPWVVNDLRDAEDGNRDCLWVDARPSLDSSVPGTYRTVAELDEAEGLQAIWTLADATFIAHAREDIPALLAALAAERDRADRAEADLENANITIRVLTGGRG